MSDYIIRATAAEGQIRAFAATTRELTEFARQAHNTSPVATYLAFAKQNGQLLSLSKSRTFGLFAASPIQERGSHRYKLYATNSSNWLLYDYEGSLLT